MKVQDKMMKAIENAGFEIIKHEREIKGKTVKKIYCQEVPDTLMLKEALRNITGEYKIKFYDDDPQEYDEEGGYGQAIIIDENNILFMENNHEWMTEWQSISLDDLAFLLRCNWELKDAWGKYKNYFLLEEWKGNNIVAFYTINEYENLKVI